VVGLCVRVSIPGNSRELLWKTVPTASQLPKGRGGCDVVEEIVEVPWTVVFVCAVFGGREFSKRRGGRRVGKVVTFYVRTMGRILKVRSSLT
jgi:hypothetical protein